MAMVVVQCLKASYDNSVDPRLLENRLAIPQQPIRLQQVRDVIPRNEFDFSLRLTRILALFKRFFRLEEDFLERKKVSWPIILSKNIPSIGSNDQKWYKNLSL